MRRRLLSLLLSVVCVLSLVVSSHSVSAVVTNIDRTDLNGNLWITASLRNKSNKLLDYIETAYHEGVEITEHSEVVPIADSDIGQIRYEIALSLADKTKLFNDYTAVSISISGITQHVDYMNSAGDLLSKNIEHTDVDEVLVHVIYTDNTRSQYTVTDCLFDDISGARIVLDFTSDKFEKPVQSIFVQLRTDLTKILPSDAEQVTMQFSLHNSEVKIRLKSKSEFIEEEGLEEEKKQSGLLATISNKIQDVFDSIKNVVSAILELPKKIGDVLLEGIKNLFVPDSDYIVSYKDKWDELLADKFGAVYEVCNIVIEFFEQIQYSSTTRTIAFPKVSLASAGIPFEFGGYDVKIIPDRFASVQGSCMIISGIACTFLFVNGLRKRYDEIMGG